MNLMTILKHCYLSLKRVLKKLLLIMKKKKKSFFLNPEYIELDSLFIIWNLFHEIRHAIQYKTKI